MKKLRPIKSTWYNWQTSYIPEPIRKSLSTLKDKISSVHTSITLEQTLPELFMGEDKN